MAQIVITSFHKMTRERCLQIIDEIKTAVNEF